MTEQKFIDYPYGAADDITEAQKCITEMIESGWRIKISYSFVSRTGWPHIIVIYEKETSSKPGMQ